jgi:hypothetical protein
VAAAHPAAGHTAQWASACADSPLLQCTRTVNGSRQRHWLAAMQWCPAEQRTASLMLRAAAASCPRCCCRRPLRAAMCQAEPSSEQLSCRAVLCAGVLPPLTDTLYSNFTDVDFIDLDWTVRCVAGVRWASSPCHRLCGCTACGGCGGSLQEGCGDRGGGMQGDEGAQWREQRLCRPAGGPGLHAAVRWAVL